MTVLEVSRLTSVNRRLPPLPGGASGSVSEFLAIVCRALFFGSHEKYVVNLAILAAEVDFKPVIVARDFVHVKRLGEVECASV